MGGVTIFSSTLKTARKLLFPAMRKSKKALPIDQKNNLALSNSYGGTT